MAATRADLDLLVAGLRRVALAAAREVYPDATEQAQMATASIWLARASTDLMAEACQPAAPTLTEEV